MNNKRHLGVMRVSMECLKRMFQLPDDYEVVSVHIDSLTNEVRLLVSNPALPAAAEFQQLPSVDPLYLSFQINETQRGVMLTGVRVTEHPAYSREEILAQL